MAGTRNGLAPELLEEMGYQAQHNRDIGNASAACGQNHRMAWANNACQIERLQGQSHRIPPHLPLAAAQMFDGA